MYCKGFQHNSTPLGLQNILQNFIKKRLQGFSSEICEIFKNYIREHLRTNGFMVRGKRNRNSEREGKNNKPAPKTNFLNQTLQLNISFTI